MRFLVFAMLLALPSVLWGASNVIIRQESFELGPDAATYTVEGDFFEGPQANFFVRTNSSFTEYDPMPTNIHGSFAWFTEDTDDAPLGRPAGALITLAEVDLTGWSNISVALAIQDADADYERSDFIEIYVITNGSASNLIGAIRGTDPNTDAIHNDADLTGTGDLAGLTSFPYFTDFEYDLATDPTSIVVLVLTKTSVDTEALAIDNLRIIGDIDVLPTNPPAMVIKGTGGYVISNGSATAVASNGTLFTETTLTGTTETVVFTILNNGLGNLLLTGSPPVTVPGHADFTISAQPASTNLATTESTTFTLQYGAITAGVRTATVSVLNNETNVPYTFLVQGDAVDGTEWSNKMDITFCGYAKGEGLSNFPALIKLSTNIALFSYSDVTTNGADIRFFNSAENALLPHDINTWDTNGESLIWVQVPNLATTTTKIIMYYTSSTETTFPEYVTDGSTWSENYIGVWHMEETNSPDETGNENNGTATSEGLTATNGINDIGNSLFYGPGNASELTVDPNYMLPVYNNSSATSWTFAAWIIANDYPDRKVYSEYALGANGAQYRYQSRIVTTGVSHVYIRDDTITTNLTKDTKLTAWDAGWHHWAWTDTNGTITHYVDGIQDSGTYTYTRQVLTLTETRIGGGIDVHMLGFMDEVRISDGVRSSNWLWSCYQTHTSNDTFTCYSVQTPPKIHDWERQFRNPVGGVMRFAQ